MSSVKGKRGKILPMSERNMVLKILEQFLITMNKSKAVQACSEATGRSPRTIYKLAKEKSRGMLRPPKRFKKPHVKSHMRIMKYQGDVRSVIRRIVHSCFSNNVYPQLSTILETINAINIFPPFKRGTLYNLLKETGFEFTHRSRSGFFMERRDVIKTRHKFLERVKAAREEGRAIIYAGEMWLDTAKIWSKCEDSVGTATQDIKLHSESNPFFILINASTSSGFIDAAKLTLLCKTNKSNPKNEIDSSIYEDWFFTTLLPNCPADSVIVLDESKYHCGRINQPTYSWSKEQIIEWLNEAEIEVDSTLSTEHLLKLVNELKEEYGPFKIDVKSEEAGFEVLRLPPQHPELNLLTTVWEHIENYMKSKSDCFKKDEVMQLIENAYDAVTTEVWVNACMEEKENEDLLWTVDCLQDNVEGLIERLKPDEVSMLSSLTPEVSDTTVETLFELEQSSSRISNASNNT